MKKSLKKDFFTYLIYLSIFVGGGLFIFIYLELTKSEMPGDYGRGYTLGENYLYQYDIVINRVDTNFYNNLGYLKPGIKIRFHYPNGSTKDLLLEKGTAIISSFINRVGFDSSFILVEQKPLDSIWGNNLEKPGNLNKAKEKLLKSKIYNYWIIDKRTDEVYGPYSWKGFKKQCALLGVSKDIKLLSKNVETNFVRWLNRTKFDNCSRQLKE